MVAAGARAGAGPGKGLKAPPGYLLNGSFFIEKPACHAL